MKKGRILIVDNEAILLGLWKQRIELEGYRVFVATNPIEAKEVIQANRVHVAIIDMKLTDHSDANDISGIELSEELDPLIVIIILTAYADIETMKRALAPRLGDKALAFNYIPKDGTSELLNAIKQAFEDRVKMNLDLGVKLSHRRPSGTLIYLKGEEAFEYLIDEVRDKSISALEKKEMADQLEEVFEKLFYAFHGIMISPISTKRGYSGAGVVFVERRDKEEGTASSVVVKFGIRKAIVREARNYEKYAKPFLQFRATEVGGPVYSQNLGGMMYTLVGADLKNVRNLRDCFDEDESLTAKVLERVFKETCQLWYRNRGKPQDLDLARLYRQQIGLFPYNKLEKALKDVFPEYDKKFTIAFSGLKEDFVNPVIWLKGREFPINGYACITHGDLHGGNILVDENGYPWLIDFFRTGPGHVFRDFVELEADIKFNCLETSDIEALYEFENSLSSSKKFDDSCKFENKKRIGELTKAFNLIRTLRGFAQSVAGSSNDIREYYIGILYHTINMIRYADITKERKRHALLSASIISQRLEKWK